MGMGGSLCCPVQDDGHEITVTDEYFPMTCITVSTFMSMDRMLSHGTLQKRGLLVRPGVHSKVHFLSHEWLGYTHPDPHGVQLGRMQNAFRSVMNGEVRELFEDNDWTTFAEGMSVTWKSSMSDIEGGARHSQVSEASFAEDVSGGLVWLDFGSVPQLVDSTGEDHLLLAHQQQLAISSIPSYLECSTYFWVVTVPAKHNNEEKQCDFYSWRSRGWCRLEEWANLLSVKSFMPLIVTDDVKISTYSLVAFQLSNMQKLLQSPCNGDFSCCRMNHVGFVGNVPYPIKCDKAEITKVMSKMYPSKMRSLLNKAPGMAYLLRGLKPVIFAGATDFLDEAQDDLLEDEKEVEVFARKFNFPTVDALGGADCDLLTVAGWSTNTLILEKLLAPWSPGAEFNINAVGHTCLDTCALSGNVAGVRLLMESGHISERHGRAVNKLGGTTLQTVAENGHAEIVKLFLSFRADVNVGKEDHSPMAGMTALHCASASCHASVCEVLLKYDADINARTAKGRSAFQIASSSKLLCVGNSHRHARDKTVEVLLEHGADRELDDVQISAM